jgi:catecholate siderophore receptor
VKSRLVALLLAAGIPSGLLAQAEPRTPETSDTTPQVLPTLEVRARAASGYGAMRTRTATKTDALLRDVPQSVTVVSKSVIADQQMQGMADVVRYIPGVTVAQGEGNRDQATIRGNNTTAGFFVDGMRDDVQYFRDLYNVERVEALKGANSLIFGRGVGGGALNRVMKSADWTPTRELQVEGGSYGTRRSTLDIGEGVSGRLALRLNGMYENSDLYRRDVSLERYGINPTATLRLTPATRLSASYERFKDQRTADRGIPSFQGAPLAIASPRTFFGDPSVSHADALVNLGTVTLEHTAGSGLTIRNRSVFADYNKIYQNVYPGAVDSTGSAVQIVGYNNATDRRNLLNETEITYPLVTGGVQQTLLGGVAVGRQITDNFRNTAYFDDTALAVLTPLSRPTIAAPVTFRQSATDADNHSNTTTLSVYGQSQLFLSQRWRAIVGARYERFTINFFNQRTGEALSRTDNLVSPRAGLLFKPAEAVTLYSSYSVSALPSSGDQFSSLTATTETLEPEKFTNYEVGAKWDVLDRVSLAAAAYRLDRTNTTAPDPIDPSRTVQTGSQRTTGVELSVSGAITPAWQVIGGYTNQKAEVTSATTAAPVGARVALVPRNTVSLWNRYQVASSLGFGLGVIYQDDMFAAIDDQVTLPSFVRVDAAAYYTVNRWVRLQANVENVFDRSYFPTANSNNNITPGSPRAVRVTVATGF